MDQLLTPKQLSQILNCKASTVYLWAAEGKIPAFKLNGILRFSYVEIEKWMERNQLSPEKIEKQAMKILKSTKSVNINSLVRGTIDSVK